MRRDCKIKEDDPAFSGINRWNTLSISRINPAVGGIESDVPPRRETKKTVFVQALFIKSKRLKTPREIAYPHLIDFVSDFKLPSVHVKKSRVWAVKQSFHFLVLHQWASKDIARGLQYPKIEKSPELGHGIKSTFGLSRN